MLHQTCTGYRHRHRPHPSARNRRRQIYRQRRVKFLDFTFALRNDDKMHNRSVLSTNLFTRAMPQMRVMAMAMAIASAKFDGEIFFCFNTAKLFRLGGILALRWHFGPPLAYLPTLANLLAF